MKILLTGATGLLGRSLLDISSGTENDFYCLVRNKENSDHLKYKSNIQWIESDLSKPLDFSKLPENIDVVIHLAQSLNYKSFPEFSHEIFLLNTIATHNLMEYARHAKVKHFIYASTGSVYEGDYSKTAESTLLTPQSFYPSTKFASEILLNSYKQFFDVCILRLFFLYGEFQREDRLIPRIAENIKNNIPIKIYGENGLSFTPTYSGDVAKILLKAIHENWKGYLNIATSEVVTIREIANKIAKLFEKRPILEHHEYLKTKNIIPDTALLTQLNPGFTFSTLREGLEKTFHPQIHYGQI